MNVKSSSSPPDAARMVMWVLVVCLCIQIALVPFQAGILYDHPMVVDRGDSLVMLTALLGTRLMIVAIAVGLLIRSLLDSFQRPGQWLFTTMALVVLGEVLGRYIFYAFYYRIGV